MKLKDITFSIFIGLSLGYTTWVYDRTASEIEFSIDNTEEVITLYNSQQSLIVQTIQILTNEVMSRIQSDNAIAVEVNKLMGSTRASQSMMATNVCECSHQSETNFLFYPWQFPGKENYWIPQSGRRLNE